MQKQNSFWGKQEGKPNQLLKLECGFCALQLKHYTGSWSIAHSKLPGASELTFSSEAHEESLTDPHIYQTGRSDNLYIQAAMPPKPIVFRNNKKIMIRPQQSLRIFLAVPLYIQVYYKQVDAEHLLVEFESERLSDTWFGEPDSGLPSFSVGSRFALYADELNIASHEVLVPVNIQNNSTQLLDLQRLLVRVEMMNLYMVKQQLVADLAQIEFKGQNQMGNLHFVTDKTTHGSSPSLIGKARHASNRNILGHSFHMIKQMTQLP